MFIFPFFSLEEASLVFLPCENNYVLPHPHERHPSYHSHLIPHLLRHLVVMVPGIVKPLIERNTIWDANLITVLHQVRGLLACLLEELKELLDVA